MCDCSYTLLDIVKIANKIRQKNELPPLPYSYVIKEWHNLLDNYEGKRNPYWANGKIGLNYIFSKFKANKIAKKMVDIKYKGNSKSFGYQYWWKAA
jgi:hypothetical protein